MVKFYCCTLSAFFLALMLFSCEKDDAEPSPYLSFSIDESFVKEGISFDYKGGSMDIGVIMEGTVSDFIMASLPSDFNDGWCSVKKYGNSVEISVKESDIYRESRNTIVTIKFDSVLMQASHFTNYAKKEYKIPIRQTGNFVSSEGSTVRVYVEEGRTLANSYGRGDGFNWFIVDSLIVEGFLHDDDFHTICEYGHGKKLSGLDLSNAIFEDKLFIPDYCFNRNWPNLSMIKLPQGTVGIGYCAFYGSPKLKSVSMPNSVVELGSHAFGECFLLSTIILSESIGEIKQYTFYKCEALTRITIPASVKEIHSSSFIGCSHLKIVHLKSKTPPTISDFPFLCSKEYEVNEDNVIIGGTPLKIILYVPAGCEEAYKNSSWAQNAIEIIGE